MFCAPLVAVLYFYKFVSNIYVFDVNPIISIFSFSNLNNPGV